jgi:hypothetical protein
MADAKDSKKYRQGGGEEGLDPVGDNPTGRARKSSSRQRRKKLRKLFKGTPWEDKK